MCGICGIIPEAAHKIPDRSVLERMAGSLKHRGPDKENIFLEPGVGLGHQRLSVIDLETGSQPMSDSTGRYTLIFNGEIYNYQDLRATLEAQGVKFGTQSDTEVLLQSYIRRGKDCLRDLVGMFAFAIWDSEERILFAARDRLGKKPFYYSSWQGSFYFASEIKSILQVPNFPREVNAQAIASFFAYTYVLHPSTALRHIFELPPAHFLEWKEGGLNVSRYWQPSFIEKIKISEDEACEVLWQRLKEAVRVRMISDVPLGAFLSGGIDSSIVVALMSELASFKVKTFSIGFEEMGYNELPYARQVADLYKTDHQEYLLRPKAADMMEKMVWHYDQPFSDVSALPSFCVAQMARKHVTVVLNGDGGDEGFCGYTRFIDLMRWNELCGLPGIFPRILAALTGGISPIVNQSPFFTRAKIFFRDLSSRDSMTGYFRQMIQFRSQDRARLFRSDFIKAFLPDSPENRLREIYGRGLFTDPMDGFLALELDSYLSGDLLVKMDRATMAYGLEARSPFLDHRVIEFSSTLPFSMKCRAGTTKLLLKKMMKGKLPDSILSRPKQGFGVPISRWLRGELKQKAQEILFDSVTRQRPYFQETEIQKLWDDHQDGRAQHGHRLWSLLMFELWHRMFIDQVPHAVCEPYGN